MYETATAVAPHIEQVEKRLYGLRDDLMNLHQRVQGIRDEIVGSRPQPPQISAAKAESAPLEGFLFKTLDQIMVLERSIISTKDVLAEIENAVIRRDAGR